MPRRAVNHSSRGSGAGESGGEAWSREPQEPGFVRVTEGKWFGSELSE